MMINLILRKLSRRRKPTPPSTPKARYQYGRLRDLPQSTSPSLRSGNGEPAEPGQDGPDIVFRIPL